MEVVAADNEAPRAVYGVERETLNEDVLSKYRAAARICNETLQQLLPMCVPGADISELSKATDENLERLIAELPASEGEDGETMEKGIALPTCMAVNEIAGFHVQHAPGVLLAAGDVVKINFGVHVDGYIAQIGHTHICGLGDQPMRGRRADVVCAAYAASQLVHRMLRPGVKSQQLTQAVHELCRDFGCHATEETFSCSIQRFVHEGNKVFLNRLQVEDAPDGFEIEADDVFTIDIMVSNHSPKLRSGDIKPTVLIRNLAVEYQLKSRIARHTYAEIARRFPTMWFAANRLETEGAPLGIKECVEHNLLVPYSVRTSKPGTQVAQFRFTAVVTPEHTLRLTSHPPPFVQSTFGVRNEEQFQLLSKVEPDEGVQVALPVNSAGYKPVDVDALVLGESEDSSDVKMHDRV